MLTIKLQKKNIVFNVCIIDKGPGVFLNESLVNGKAIKPKIAKTIKKIPKVLFEKALKIA